jgi:Xaa-Pro aminopeptidase
MLSEYKSRCEKLRNLMKTHGLDAVVITSNPNYYYYTGHSTWAWAQKTRPFIVVIPIDTEPKLIIPEMDIMNAKDQSWIADCITWSELPFDPSIVVEALRIRKGSKIGLECGSESRIGVTALDFERLQGRLRRRGATLVDASHLLWDVRCIKSEFETHLVEMSARCMSKAYETFFEKADRSLSERQMASLLAQEMLQAGADAVGFIIIGSHSGFLSDKRIPDGSLLRIDAGCIYRGYWSDFSRSAVIGHATGDQEAVFHAARGILHNCLRRVRDGSSIAELADYANSELSRLGLPGITTGRIGHGIGLDVTEPPSIARWEDSAFKRNMTCALEPVRFLRSDGVYHVEENFLVTGDGFRPISEPDEVLHLII